MLSRQRKRDFSRRRGQATLLRAAGSQYSSGLHHAFSDCIQVLIDGKPERLQLHAPKCAAESYHTVRVHKCMRLQLYWAFIFKLLPCRLRTVHAGRLWQGGGSSSTPATCASVVGRRVGMGQENIPPWADGTGNVVSYCIIFI